MHLAVFRTHNHNRRRVASPRHLTSFAFAANLDHWLSRDLPTLWKVLLLALCLLPVCTDFALMRGSDMAITRHTKRQRDHGIDYYTVDDPSQVCTQSLYWQLRV